MITLKQWMECCNYRITEGGDYGWNCFGSNAYCLDSWNGEQDGHTISIVFDTQTHEIYQVEAFDYSRERAYRLINPRHKTAFENECKTRDELAQQAWDNVNFVDLETDEDWLEKAQAICNNMDYDTRVSVPLNIPDEELFQLMKLAHESDMSFNNYVEEILRNSIESFNQNQPVERVVGKVRKGKL